MSSSSLLEDRSEESIRPRTSDERTTIPESSRENVLAEYSERSTLPESSRENVRSEYSERSSIPESSRENVRSAYSDETRGQTQSEDTMDSRSSKPKIREKRASRFQKSFSRNVSWQTMGTGGDRSPSIDLRGMEQGRRKTMSFQQDFDVNQYITKKTVTCGMMDVALMMSNAAQLKTLVEVGTENPTYYLLLSLVLASIALQIGVGLIFMMTGKTSITRQDKQLQRNKWNNAATMGVFFITVINILTNTFGISSSPPVPPSH